MIGRGKGRDREEGRDRLMIIIIAPDLRPNNNRKLNRRGEGEGGMKMIDS